MPIRLSYLGVELPDYAEERLAVEIDETLREEHKQNCASRCSLSTNCTATG